MLLLFYAVGNSSRRGIFTISPTISKPAISKCNTPIPERITSLYGRQASYLTVKAIMALPTAANNNFIVITPCNTCVWVAIPNISKWAIDYSWLIYLVDFLPSTGLAN